MDVELRDLYDKNRQLTGGIIKKGDPIPNGKYILVVLAIIQNSKGDFLIQKRSKQKGGKFAFTGGHAKTGENSIQAIITEVKEELGLDIAPTELKLFYSDKDEDCFFDLYYVKKDFDINSLVLQKEEVESVRWCTEDEIHLMENNNIFFGTHYESFVKFLNFYNNKEVFHEKRN